MRSFIRFLLASTLCIPFLSAPAQLQRVRVVRIHIDTSCDPSYMGELTFDHCGLRFDHWRLIQGNDERQIDRPTFTRPVRLQRYVVGDSAIRYATRYQWQASVAQGLVSAGTASLLASIIYPKLYPCPEPACDRAPVRALSRNLLRASALSFTIGIPLSFIASNTADRAVLWHNRSLSRH